MGALPSCEAPETIFSLRYGSHEVGLIPLVRKYFNSDHPELRKQFIRVRNDPSIRYHHLRNPQYSMRRLPPVSYTEQDLDLLLDLVEDTLYDTNETLVAAVEKLTASPPNPEASSCRAAGPDGPKKTNEVIVRPVPCAVCFVYVNGREETDCFAFFDRKINVIGYFGCRTNEDKPDEEPFLQARKAILKAAGDRTLERVMMLSAIVYRDQFLQVVKACRPSVDAHSMFEKLVSRVPLKVTTLYNSYPTLKFLHDTAVLACAMDELHIDGNSLSIADYERGIDEKGMSMVLSGELLGRGFMWTCSMLKHAATRGMWVQLILDEKTQLKDKRVATWLASSPEAKTFLGSEEVTRSLTDHLDALHNEIVRARETPLESPLWGEDKEYSHDGKLYRIFNSPNCGPFLTTVKPSSFETKPQAAPDPFSMNNFDTMDDKVGAGAGFRQHATPLGGAPVNDGHFSVRGNGSRGSRSATHSFDMSGDLSGGSGGFPLYPPPFPTSGAGLPGNMISSHMGGAGQVMMLVSAPGSPVGGTTGVYHPQQGVVQPTSPVVMLPGVHQPGSSASSTGPSYMVVNHGMPQNSPTTATPYLNPQQQHQHQHQQQQHHHQQQQQQHMMSGVPQQPYVITQAPYQHPFYGHVPSGGMQQVMLPTGEVAYVAAGTANRRGSMSSLVGGVPF